MSNKGKPICSCQYFHSYYATYMIQTLTVWQAKISEFTASAVVSLDSEMIWSSFRPELESGERFTFHTVPSIVVCSWDTHAWMPQTDRCSASHSFKWGQNTDTAGVVLHSAPAKKKGEKKAGCEVFPRCSSTSQFEKLCSVVPNLPVSMQTSRRGRSWLRRERGSTTNQTDGASAACWSFSWWLFPRCVRMAEWRNMVGRVRVGVNVACFIKCFDWFVEQKITYQSFNVDFFVR